VKRDAEKRFLKKHLVFEIPEEYGEKLIKIDLDRAKKECIIPQKIKEIYNKEQEILSLIDENLDDNSVAIMKGDQEGMENILNMELADNKLTNISFITENFPKLDRLQLSRNKITKVDTIARLKDMKKLNLRNNELQELPDELCELPVLEGLNIRHNKLKALPDNFGNLKLLKKL
jgi:Leucine-rich repeat (LRR) protein